LRFQRLLQALLDSSVARRASQGRIKEHKPALGGDGIAHA